MKYDVKFSINTNALVHNSSNFEEIVCFVLEAEKLNYDYIRLIDHVVGFVSEKHTEVAPTPYTHDSKYHEVFTLMSYLSAVTEEISFITGVLNLPQRQTALVAKQAAQVDLMSSGRLILGVGIGYNSVESLAMEAVFKERAPRVEEQIEVLRKLWCQDLVSFKGRWHEMQDININPPPIQQPIPIWMGAGRMAKPVPPEKVLRRIGKYADGFMPLFRIDEKTGCFEEDALDAIDYVKKIASESEHNSNEMALELSLYPQEKSKEKLMDEMEYLVSIGATIILARFPNGPLVDQIKCIKEFSIIRDEFLNGTTSSILQAESESVS